MTPFAFSRAAHRHASCFCYAEPPQSIVPRSPIVAATIAAAVMGAHGRHSIARDDSSVRHRPTGCSGRSFYEPGTAAGWRFSSSGRRPSGHAGTVRQCSRSTLGTLRDATTFARNPPLADLCSRTPLLSVRAVTASHRGRVNIPNVSPAPAEASRQRGRISGGWRFKKPPTSDQRRSHNFHRVVTLQTSHSRNEAIRGPTWEHLCAEDCASARQMVWFFEGFWRRRPDLNRGWRFCRPYRVVIRSA
jgi:hypothetical protein